MALASNALTTVAKLRRYMGTDVDRIDYLSIYHDATGGVASATVEVTATAVILVDDVVGTSTLTFAANATLSAMVTAIDAIAGYVVVQGATADDSLATSDLEMMAAIDALLVANTRFLIGADTIALEDAVNAASDDLRRHCGRTNFQSTTYRRRFDGSGTNSLVLPDGPITEVVYAAVGTEDAVKLRFTDSTARYATVRNDGTSLILTSFDGSQTQTSITLSGNDLTALVVAINAESNWEAELLGTDPGSWGSTELLRTEAIHALDSWVNLEMPGEPERELRVDKLASMLKRRADSDIDFDVGNLKRGRYATPPRMRFESVWPMGLGNVIVKYTAGETVPAQVEKTCNQLAANIARGSRHESNVAGEAVPGYSRTRGDGELTEAMIDSLLKFVHMAASVPFEDV